MECQCKTALTAKHFGKPSGLALQQELDEFAERAGESGEFLEIGGREVGPGGHARFPFAAAGAPPDWPISRRVLDSATFRGGLRGPTQLPILA